METGKEVVKAVIDESKALIKPVYEDLAQPAVKEIGTTLGRSVHALLSPIRGLCWGFEKIEHVTIQGLEKRLEKVATEKQKTPDPEIAVPLMQALTYTAQNDTLREMYLNLLANSMNSDYDKAVHPSYVDLIKQMNRLDALVFQKLTRYSEKYIPVIRPRIILREQNKFMIAAMPEYFLGWIVEMFDIFDISTCLVRLSRLGLIEIDLLSSVLSDEYDKLESSELLNSIFNAYTKVHANTEYELEAKKGVLSVNEFGKRFAEACL